MKSPTKYLGLELGGSKSSRTAVVVLDYYKDKNKVFVSEIFTHIQGDHEETGDERLVERLNAYRPSVIGVNAPLSLPPCITCTLPVCPTYQQCSVPAVEWMRKQAKKLKLSKAKHPTPYTQRPGDVALRGMLNVPLEETLGAGRSPLAARMQYLKRHMSVEKLIEVNSRVALSGLIDWYRLSARDLRRYRNVEFGVETRYSILERMGEESSMNAIPDLFLYKADTLALAQHLVAFDAFLSAMMALASDLGLLAKAPGPSDWGFVASPKVFGRTKNLPKRDHAR